MDNTQQYRPTQSSAPTGLKQPLALPGIDKLRNPTFGYLLALQGKAFSGMTYSGTVPPEVIARRRAKNKLAKASRKRNRGQ